MRFLKSEFDFGAYVTMWPGGDFFPPESAFSTHDLIHDNGLNRAVAQGLGGWDVGKNLSPQTRAFATRISILTVVSIND